MCGCHVPSEATYMLKPYLPHLVMRFLLAGPCAATQATSPFSSYIPRYWLLPKYSMLLRLSRPRYLAGLTTQLRGMVTVADVENRLQEKLQASSVVCLLSRYIGIVEP